MAMRGPNCTTNNNPEMYSLRYYLIIIFEEISYHIMYVYICCTVEIHSTLLIYSYVHHQFTLHVHFIYLTISLSSGKAAMKMNKSL